VVATLAIVPYLGGLGNGFTFDDEPIAAENTRIRSIEGVGRAFASDWWDGTMQTSRLYRPLPIATYSADYTISRLAEAGPAPHRLPDRSAVPFHVQNVIWHAATSLALFVFVFEMYGTLSLALVTGALFAVHPIHTEAVYGIVGRAELMAACFALASLIVARRVFRNDPHGAASPLLAAVLCFLALLSKEHPIVLPAVPLLWLLYLSRPERRAVLGRRSYRLLLGSLGAAAVVYLVVRTAVLGSITGIGAVAGKLTDLNNVIATATGIPRWLTPVRVFGEVLRLLVFPRTLSVDYSFRQIPLVTSPDLATFGCLLALAGVPVLAFVIRDRLSAASFGILFFLLTWMLASNLVLPIGTILGERLLYLPSAGFCLAIAGGLVAAGRRLRGPMTVLVVAMVLLGAARTWARGSDWRNNLTLFESAALASPRSCKVQYNLANELRSAGRTSEAIAHLERALELGPNDSKIHNNLAGMLAAEGRVDDAVAHLEQAIRIDPDDADAQFNLGSLLQQSGRLDEAIEHMERAARLKPGAADIAHATGTALEARGRRSEAIDYYRKALAIDPANAEAHNDLGVALARANRIPEAVEEFREAVRINPGFGVAADNLRQAEGRKGSDR
jgi:tetratricopeptide (TPR) repeat protein